MNTQSTKKNDLALQNNQDLKNANVEQQETIEDYENDLKKTFGKKSRNTLQRKANSTGMPNDVRDKMETAFNTDFSDVKIHNNSPESEKIGAIAYTQGTDLHFTTGAFNPETTKGQEVLGHELTHVVQQKQGSVQANEHFGGLALNTSSHLEKQADLFGTKAAQNQSITNIQNSFSGGSGTSVVQAMFGRPNATEADVLNLKNVREALGLGFFSMEGKTIKSVQSQVKLFESLDAKIQTALEKKKAIKSGGDTKPIDKEIDLAVAETYRTLDNLATMTDMYNSRHTDDKSREARNKGMAEVARLTALAINELQAVRSSADAMKSVPSGTEFETDLISKDIKKLRDDRNALATSQVDTLALEAAKYIKVQVADSVAEVFGVGVIDLKKSAEAIELRKTLKAAVRQVIETEMKASGTAEQQADALRYMEELAAANQKSILDAISKTQAGKITDAILSAEDSNIKKEIKSAIIAAPLSNKDAKVLAIALNAGKNLLSDIKAKAVKKAQDGLKDQTGGAEDITAKLKEAILGGSTTEAEYGQGAKGIGKKEIDDRIAKEALIESLATEQLAGEIADKKIGIPLKSALAYKLGEKRKWLMKSSGARQFRQELKDSARETSAQMIKEEITTNYTTSSQAKQNYTEMIAQSEAYGDVKKYVDQATLEAIDKIVAKVLTDSVKNKIRTASKSSLYDYLRSEKKQNDKKRIAAALSGAVSGAAAQYLNVEAAANLIADQTLTDKKVDTYDIKEKTVEKTKTYDVKATVKKAFEADTIGTAFNLIGKFIGTVVPSTGSSASIDLTARIPVYSDGGVTAYLMFEFMGEAEREHNTKKNKDEIMAHAELSFGAGATVAAMFDINAQFGLFAEAQGATTHQLMQLFSYGAFRNISKISSKFADWLWGRGGKTIKTDATGKKTGMYTSHEEAEMWAALVEEEAFKSKSDYVTMGLVEKGKATANLGGGVKGEFELKSTQGRKYKKGTGGSTPQESGVLTVEGGGSIEFCAGAGAAELKGQSVWQRQGGTTYWMGMEVEGGGQIIAPLGQDPSKWVKIVSGIVTPLAGTVSKFTHNFFNQSKEEVKTNVTGSVIQTVMDSPFPLSQIDGGDIAKKVLESAGDDFKDQVMGESNPLFSGTSALGISIKLGYMKDKPTKAREWEVEIALNYIKGFSADAYFGVAEVETSQRLAALKISSDGIAKAEIFGIGKHER